MCRATLIYCEMTCICNYWMAFIRRLGITDVHDKQGRKAASVVFLPNQMVLIDCTYPPPEPPPPKKNPTNKKPKTKQSIYDSLIKQALMNLSFVLKFKGYKQCQSIFFQTGLFFLSSQFSVRRTVTSQGVRKAIWKLFAFLSCVIHNNQLLLVF